jgi:UDP-glucuronate decarboxylase
MRILVTGGAGFLGSHLCDRLTKRGFHVACMDNLYTGSEENISHLLGLTNFEFLKQDVVEPVDLHFDVIYNLACPASPAHYQRDPVTTTRTSVLGAMNMLELARKNNIPILQASTSEVYGDPEMHPQTETYWGNVNPIGDRSCYDEGKRCAETLFFDYHRQYATQVRVVRIFNTYGPRMHPNDGRVVSNFIVQALLGQDLTIYGDGQQTRSFCYVDDMIDGFLNMMESSNSFMGPVTLGNPNEFTMLELAEKVRELIGGSSKLVFKPLPSDDPKQRKPDIALAKEKLSWTPTIELEEGLSKTIEYFRKKLKIS